MWLVLWTMLVLTDMWVFKMQNKNPEKPIQILPSELRKMKLSDTELILVARLCHFYQDTAINVMDTSEDLMIENLRKRAMRLAGFEKEDTIKKEWRLNDVRKNS